jgi:very-short-patch-repair endonuclease
LTGGTQSYDAPIESFSLSGNFKYSPEIAKIADLMRKNPTAAEKHLWNNLLRSSQLGFKFVRQKPIHHFILDFYCSNLLVGIEADGDIHDLQVEKDQTRTEYLNNLGIAIIRFKNEEILFETQKVKEAIMDFLSQRKKQLSRYNFSLSISSSSQMD